MSPISPPPPVRVVIIDDHRMFADCLALLLGAEDDIAVVGTAAGGAEGIALVHALRPDVVLLDQRLPDIDGIAVAAEIRSEDHAARIVMLTASTEGTVMLSALKAGCSGFVTKDGTADEIRDAVRCAAVGGSPVSPSMLSQLLPCLTPTRPRTGDDLTPSQLAVLEVMAEGVSNRVIAERLFLSVNTVRNYVQAILGKLGAHSRLEAIVIAVREGVLSDPAQSTGLTRLAAVGRVRRPGGRVAAHPRTLYRAGTTRPAGPLRPVGASVLEQSTR